MLFFFLIVLFFAYVCARVCECFFLLFKSKVRNNCPTVLTLAEYLRRHDIYDVMFRQRADMDPRGPIWVRAKTDMDHARADMGSRERADMAFASRAISARVTKQTVTIYSKTCDKCIYHATA